MSKVFPILVSSRFSFFLNWFKSEGRFHVIKYSKMSSFPLDEPLGTFGISGWIWNESKWNSMGNPYSSFIERKVFSSINSTYLPQTKQNHPHYRFPGNLSETSKPIKKSRSVCMSRTFFPIILVPRDNALITVSLFSWSWVTLIFTRY